MSEHIESSLKPGSAVYMTGFVSLDEIYIRKLEDHNDTFDDFLDMVNKFCSSAVPINRPLVINEIVGAQSTLDGSFYRGKVLKKINDTTYSIQFIDFGDIDNVSVSNIFEIPNDFMTPSTVMKITLDGVKSNQLNTDTLNYINNLLTNYEPMFIDFSLVPFKNVILTTVNDNENVNEQLNKLLNNNDSTTLTEVINQPISKNVDVQVEIPSNNTLPILKNGDSVYITTFIDVHHIFIRKVEDENDNFFNFIENVNKYCSSETPIGKLPKLDEVIGAKSIVDGLFYRAKVIKKINDVSYNVQFIDYGIEENVNLSNIVSLSSKLKLFIPTTILVKLKDVSLHKLNDAARKYITFISENETLIINSIEHNTNEVILKTDKNENINDHLNTFFQKELNSSEPQELKKNELSLEAQIFFKCDDASLHPDDIVYMTAFGNLNEIFIRKLEDYNDEFHNFLDEVDKFCSLAEPINRSLVIDEIIGAQSALDDRFYRGKVIKKVDDTTYLINFIDFGDSDNVPMSRIFEIPKKFMIPSTVMKVTLKGIKSSHKLSVEASNYITNLLVMYEPMIINFDPKFPLKDITLVIPNSNENVNANIIKLLKDVDNIETNVVRDKLETENVLFTVPQNIQHNHFHNETNILKNGDTVYITAYVNIYNIFVRKVKDNNDVFKKFIESVNSYCSESNSKSEALELNQIVGTRSLVDGYFYRGKILEKIDDNNYYVKLIDYGFNENVNVVNIVSLPIHLQQVESNISLVGLQGSIFKDLNPESNKYLENLMSNNIEMKIEFEELTAVTLTIINENKNVIEHLNKIHEDYNAFDNTMLNASVPSISGMKYMANNINIPEIPPLINKSIVTIHAFISLKNIYISVLFNRSEVDKFLKDLSMFCLNSQPITRNPILGEILGIRSSVDGSFNRGMVEEKLNDNQYKVVLFDSGTKDIVSSNSFVEIPEYVKQVPQSIYSISLKDLNTQNINAQVMSYINMLCENIPLIIEFNENSPNKLHEVTLTTVKTQQNVNNHLANLFAEKERDSPETVQMLSKGDIVYITSFVDLQSVYVRRINNSTDKFKSFLEHFSSYCALEQTMENEPKVGEIIAAKEKNGTKFYRAEILSKVDNEHFSVCFIDLGSRNIVHKSNIVQPSEIQLLNYTPLFIIGLHGLNSETLKPAILQYIEKISQTDTFIIDSINEQNKAVLISVNTQYNINKEIKKLIVNNVLELKIKNDLYPNHDVGTDIEKSVITYYYPPLEIPVQVWVAEKISSSRYLVHTYDSRLEFMRLEKQIFEDSKTLKCVKSINLNMLCIVYFSPSWYRGEILEVIDNVTAKVGLIDVGNFHVLRNIGEIFQMPLKYKGKSLLLNIDIQPEPQDKLSITTFKIVAKKHLENITIVELLTSTVNEIYGDLENVGLPSFSSTPIQEYSGEFPFINTEQNMVSETNGHSKVYLPSKQFSSVLTINDVQLAKWLKMSLKTLTFLCMYHEYFIMRDYLTENALKDLENKIYNYCLTVNETYSPAVNELCLAKYCDEMWYRAVCVNITTDSSDNSGYLVFFLDWGIEYKVNIDSICKMPKEFIYLPVTAHKCIIQDVNPLKWDANTMNEISQYFLTQVKCKVIDKLSDDIYKISCDFFKTLIDSNLQ